MSWEQNPKPKLTADENRPFSSDSTSSFHFIWHIIKIYALQSALRFSSFQFLCFAFGQKMSAKLWFSFLNVSFFIKKRVKNRYPNADTIWTTRMRTKGRRNTHIFNIYFNNFVKTSNKIVKHGFRFLSFFISSNLRTISHDRFHSIRIDRNDIVHIWTLGHFITKEIYFFFFLIHRHRDSWLFDRMETDNRKKTRIDRNIIFYIFRFMCDGKQKCWTRQHLGLRYILTIIIHRPYRSKRIVVTVLCLSIVVRFCLEEFLFMIRIYFPCIFFLKVFIIKMKSAHWICELWAVSSECAHILWNFVSFVSFMHFVHNNNSDRNFFIRFLYFDSFS